MVMHGVVIVSGARTPVGAFGGSLKGVPVIELGALVLKETLKRAGLRPDAEALVEFCPEALKGAAAPAIEERAYDYDHSLQPVTIDEVVMGNVLSAGQGPNVARQAMLRAGIKKETCAYTVNKLCASGMKAVALAARTVASGDAEVVLAGGVENMSLVPYGIPSARWGARMNDAAMVDLLLYDALHELLHGYHMGVTAENIAEKYGISRGEQDALGVLSHQRARAAIQNGLFKEEIVPVPVAGRGRGETLLFDTDERPMETSIEKMSSLRPAFKKDGTVTAGNSSGINDGAAALLLMSEEKAKDLGLKPLAKISAFSFAGVDPAYMGLGPVPAVRKIIRRTGITVSDFDLIELNEAFAAQAIGCMRELGISLENTNLLGSGISIGHPIGCTGARIALTLAHGLIRTGGELGLATLCIGGGQGMAMVLERVA
jgi:acetyl-CoA C-acetyltransferase